MSTPDDRVVTIPSPSGKTCQRHWRVFSADSGMTGDMTVERSRFDPDSDQWRCDLVRPGAVLFGDLVSAQNADHRPQLISLGSDEPVQTADEAGEPLVCGEDVGSRRDVG